MSTSKKSFFTLILPRKPKDGDKIHVVVKMKKKPEIFRLLLNVRYINDKKSNLEPTMVAFELRSTFENGKTLRVTTNWKRENGWQDEKIIDNTDILNTNGLINLVLQFDGSSVLNVFDSTNSFITSFNFKYEVERINRLQLWGDILKVKSVSLKYDQKNSSSRRPSLT